MIEERGCASNVKFSQLSRMKSAQKMSPEAVLRRIRGGKSSEIACGDS